MQNTSTAPRTLGPAARQTISEASRAARGRRNLTASEVRDLVSVVPNEQQRLLLRSELDLRIAHHERLRSDCATYGSRPGRLLGEHRLTRDNLCALRQALQATLAHEPRRSRLAA